MQALDNLQAGGSTAGGAGLMLAYKIAEKNFIKEGNNRIILATDGDFNVGVSDNASMEKLVEQKRGLGIYMTVLGFGMGNIKDDKIVSIEGIDYQFETAYTRNDAVVYQVNFLTQVPYVELFLPLYQGVYASLQVDTAFIKTQIPYDDLNTQNGPDGKFSFVAPTGWKKAFLSITNETDLLYAAPDGRAGMQVISAAWNANDLTGDTEIFGAVQTELELREGYAIIVTREKKYDGWLITYAIPERDLVGMILGKRVGNTLQMVNVEYETSQTDLYRPLAEKILQGFVVK